MVAGLDADADDGAPEALDGDPDAVPFALAVGRRRGGLRRGVRLRRARRRRHRGARAGAVGGQRGALRVYAIGFEARRSRIIISLTRVHQVLGPLLMLIDTVLLLELF
jgi:hypothetical protein